jgi:hypothetical protein
MQKGLESTEHIASIILGNSKGIGTIEGVFSLSKGGGKICLR